MPKDITWKNRLKSLLVTYYDMPYGALIDYHDELAYLFTIKLQNHPHNGTPVYISRMAFKHIVESRKRDFEKRHNRNDALKSIHIIIDSLQETILTFDRYSFESNKYIYTKDYAVAGRPKLRVVAEQINGRLEIVSIHFRNRRRGK